LNFSSPSVCILVGHVIDQLRTLPDASVQMCVTSPPYWGLRDYSRCGCATRRFYSETMRTYGTPGLGGNISNGDPRTEKAPDPNCPKCHGSGKDDSLTVIWDAKDGCEHEWGEESTITKSGGTASEKVQIKGMDNFQKFEASGGSFCCLCGAWRGQLGLEPTPDLYVKHIVTVFREVWRVMRDDGTLWLNMGDCYNAARDGGWAGGKGSLNQGRDLSEIYQGRSGANVPGLKPKDLVGMPWRVAFALQADGWWLRSDIIWAKPNPMPESVTDRPTKAHEYVFLMTKSPRYFFDADAVREKNAPSSEARARDHLPNALDNPDYDSKHEPGDFRRFPMLDRLNPAGRNLRTVWTIATQPYPESHFATFPEALVERCIKAGTSEKGCCATCGAAWERVVQKTKLPEENKNIGFRPTCDHDGDPVPCVVLDPFAGSGTVGQVARNLGRSAILIEIKEEYATLIRKRVDMDHKALETYG